MNPKQCDLSVVVPVYNSAETLRRLVARVRSAIGATGRSWEIVFVDDGSSDASWDVLSELRDEDCSRITIVQLMRNYGQHNALMCGFRASSGRMVVTMDDDLQNPPEEIQKLWDAMERGQLDLVYGVEANKNHAGWRNVGSGLIRAFYRLVFKSRVSPTSFRIVRRQLVESILTYNLNYTNLDGLLAWNTVRVGAVEVQHHSRGAGRSGYSVGKLLLLALNLFTNFSLLPLQFVSICGFLAAMSGFSMGLFYLLQYLLANIAIPGFASIIIAVLVLGGAQMLALGIIGEYLGRLHLNVNRKPQYTIRRAQVRGGGSAERSGASSGAAVSPSLGNSLPSSTEEAEVLRGTAQ